MADSEEIHVWDKEADRALSDPIIEDLPVTISKWLLYYNISGKVLDLGCNIGKWYKAFAKHGFNYTGIDQSARAISHAITRYPNARFICTRIQNFLEENIYDLAFTSAVLQHNKDDRKDFILGVIRRALKKYGYYIMTENTVNSDVDGYSKTKDSWINFVTARCFSFIAYDPSGPYYLFRVIK